MKRKEFLSKAVLGSGIVLGAPAVARAVDELKEDSTYQKLIKDTQVHPGNTEQVGFNHLPNKEIRTMNSIIHRAATRGAADHGWLKTNHSFSFANYYNPERMNFGVLRVLNDDYIAGGGGFPTHPHDNMEIITIPFNGDLAHKDSMGNSSVIKSGDIQVMSAGTGILHSEFNNSEEDAVELLQIWLFPNKRNVTPRYDQMTLSALKKNEFNQILSPEAADEGVWIHQDAWFHLGEFEENRSLDYSIKREKNGVYAFVVNGEVEINGEKLSKRDAMGIWDVDKIQLKTLSSDTKILLMDVPMHVS